MRKKREINSVKKYISAFPMFAAREAVSIEKLMKLSMLKLSPELGVHRASESSRIEVVIEFVKYNQCSTLPPAPVLMLLIVPDNYIYY